MGSMRALLGFALAVALGAIAWAQGDQPGQQLSGFQLKTGTVLCVTPDGTVTRRSDVPPEMLREVMREARPMTAGSILVMRDDKLYVTPDRRTQGGAMLIETIRKS
ncbi:MAG: hypothetical protein JO212_02125 [Acetobacteraceae bacterium]|nr:hypothetical protein [Acetobacteraceae bacterium]